MCKKISFVFVYLVLFILGVQNVSAEKIICEYERYYSSAERDFIIQYDTSTKKYELATASDYHDEKENLIKYNETEYTLGDTHSGESPLAQYIYKIFLNEADSIIELSSNSCLKLYYCVSEGSEEWGVSSGSQEVSIFYDEIQKEQKVIDKKLDRDIDRCEYITANEVKNSNFKEQYSCKTYSDYMSLLNDYWSDYNISNLTKANKTVNSLKQICNSITKYSDYKSNCLKSCLNLQQDILSLKKNYGIDGISKNGECGFSKKLILYIANIVKWIKYIIPVFVIVLGILDFIKAIGADKDDEIKKAQGRFVKRLIAAALIFIIPFILEFILDKMGFGEYISECGIIDL